MMKKLKILLADDEAILRLDLREMLTDAGHEVIGEAANGEEAVKLARELKPEFVIMDVKMPIMDGLTFCTHSVLLGCQCMLLSLSFF